MPKIGNEKRIVWEDKMYYVTEFNCRGRGFKASEAEKQEEIMYEMKVWKMWVLTVESFLKSESSKIKESEFENYDLDRSSTLCERWAFNGPLLCTHFSISDWSMCRSSMPLSLPEGFFFISLLQNSNEFSLKALLVQRRLAERKFWGGIAAENIMVLIYPVSLLGRSSGWYCFETFWWYITDTQSKNVCQNITGVWWIWFGRPSLLVF